MCVCYSHSQVSNKSITSGTHTTFILYSWKLIISRILFSQISKNCKNSESFWLYTVMTELIIIIIMIMAILALFCGLF